MTLHKPLWAGGTSYDAVDWRRLLTELFLSAGVIDYNGGDLKVTQRGAGANMSVDVAAGACVVDGTNTAGQGRFFCSSDAVVNVTGFTAPGAGTSRIDRIVARVIDADFVGSGTSSWVIERVAGTAAASPSVPALPASSIPLGRVTLVSSTTSITNAIITEDRAQAGFLARGVVAAEFGTPAQAIGNGATTDKTFSTPTVRPSIYAASLFFNAGTPTRMLIPWDGLWSVSWGANGTPGGGFGWNVLLRKNADANSTAGQPAPGSSTFTTLSFGPMFLTAGEYLRLMVENNTGASLTAQSIGTTFGQPRLLFHGGT